MNLHHFLLGQDAGCATKENDRADVRIGNRATVHEAQTGEHGVSGKVERFLSSEDMSNGPGEGRPPTRRIVFLVEGAEYGGGLFERGDPVESCERLEDDHTHPSLLLEEMGNRPPRYAFSPMVGEFIRIVGDDGGVEYIRKAHLSRVEVLPNQDGTFEIELIRKGERARSHLSHPMARSEAETFLAAIVGEKDFPQHVPLLNTLVSPS